MAVGVGEVGEALVQEAQRAGTGLEQLGSRVGRDGFGEGDGHVDQRGEVGVGPGRTGVGGGGGGGGAVEEPARHEGAHHGPLERPRDPDVPLVARGAPRPPPVPGLAHPVRHGRAGRRRAHREVPPGSPPWCDYTVAHHVPEVSRFLALGEAHGEPHGVSTMRPALPAGSDHARSTSASGTGWWTGGRSGACSPAHRARPTDARWRSSSPRPGLELAERLYAQALEQLSGLIDPLAPEERRVLLGALTRS
jgi:hypothetical protein